MKDDSMKQEFMVRLRAAKPDGGNAHLPGGLIDDVASRVRTLGGQVYFPSMTRGDLAIKEIIVAVGSAGVFSGLYQVIAQFLTRNKERELSLEHEKMKIVLKGHSLLEEKEILRKLLPELRHSGLPKD